MQNLLGVMKHADDRQEVLSTIVSGLFSSSIKELET